MATQAHHQQQAPCFIRQHDTYTKPEDSSSGWMIMEGNDTQVITSTSLSSSLDQDSSAITNGSSTTSSDLVDDASSRNYSSSSSSSSFSTNGPFFELSELMAQLPIKRGLSKFYQGKSQSFTSLSRAMSIEDLAKKESPYRKRMMKSCKSYGGGLDIKATISKKVSSSSRASSSSFSSLSCSSAGKRTGSFLGGNNSINRLPPIPAQNHI